MIVENIWNAVEHEAAKSPCKKRHVGCVIIDMNMDIVAEGYNFNQTQYECEDEQGNTYDSVLHAELAAITMLTGNEIPPLTAYVNHLPCESCQAALKRAGVDRVEVRETSERWPNEPEGYGEIDLKDVSEPAHKEDPINPSHYSDIKEYEFSAKNYDAYQGFLHLNAKKYIDRMFHKEKPKQDLEKAEWYLSKLKETL